MINDELDTIVMRKLLRLLGRQINDLTVWTDGEYGPAMQARIDKAQENVDKVRVWANVQADKEIRAAYISWLDDYFERGLDEARHEMKTRTKQKEQAEYRAERARRRQATTDYAARHDVPEPDL